MKLVLEYLRFLTLPLMFLGIAVSLVEVGHAQEKDAVSYDRDIRPILSDRCFSCHGPDEESREAGLRLDQADGEEGAHAFAIVPGAIEDSELWRRITSEDEDEVMPPASAHKKQLSNEERALVKTWIEAGAEYEKFWAFEVAKRPVISDEKAKSHPIDVLAERQLEKQPTTGIAPRRMLIRRVTFDLTGLPPTVEEIQSFLDACESKGDEAAWESLVDGLLIRPSFGEHISRYWLDVVRFADTNGMHKDFYRNNIAYRDWVIRSFNENLRYDDFVRYQIAGDLYQEPTRDQLIATGFHRLHLIIDRGTALPEESFTKNVIDRLTSVGTGFMGLTVQCAQCHDHKYDPITQKDFYSLYAFLNNIDAQPETVANPKYGLQQPFVSFATEAQTIQLAEFNKKIKELDADIAKTKQAIAEEVKELEKKRAKQKLLDEERLKANQNSDGDKKTRALSEERRVGQLPNLESQAKALSDSRKKLIRQRDAVDAQVYRAMVMKERKEVRPTNILERGQYDMPGGLVERNTPEFMFPLKKSGEVPTRMDLANWLVAKENPLTARVAVNRFWQQLFGVGLVKTSEDFGAQGEVPSHPELLDWLTVEFVESGWDVKSIMKTMVMSKTYRRSSVASPDQFAADPENRMLARGARYRMDAEMIRDQILATSGLLNQELYGKSVKPPQPAGLWKAVTMTGQVFRPDAGDAVYRRSLYTFWKRAIPPPQMTILNAPNRDACIARRERTNTPSQALLLLNESEYLKAARQLAQQVLKKPAEQRIKHVWEVVTSRVPDEAETKMLKALLAAMSAEYRDNPGLATQLCDGVSLNSEEEQVTLAAWTMVASAIYNLDITKTRE